MILMKVLIFLEKKTTSTDGETTAVEKQEQYILKIVIIFSFRIKKMSDAVTKYENVFPEKVYYCPCLENAINEIF